MSALNLHSRTCQSPLGAPYGHETIGCNVTYVLITPIRLADTSPEVCAGTANCGHSARKVQIAGWPCIAVGTATILAQHNIPDATIWMQSFLTHSLRSNQGHATPGQQAHRPETQHHQGACCPPGSATDYPKVQVHIVEPQHQVMVAAGQWHLRNSCSRTYQTHLCACSLKKWRVPRWDGARTAGTPNRLESRESAVLAKTATSASKTGHE